MASNINLNNILKNAGNLMQKTQGELEKIKATGEAGAGAVEITMNGKYNIMNLVISQDILSEDKTIIEELIVAAFNNAHSKIEDMTKDKILNADALFSAFGEDANTDDEK